MTSQITLLVISLPELAEGLKDVSNQDGDKFIDDLEDVAFRMGGQGPSFSEDTHLVTKEDDQLTGSMAFEFPTKTAVLSFSRWIRAKTRTMGIHFPVSFEKGFLLDDDDPTVPDNAKA